MRFPAPATTADASPPLAAIIAQMGELGPDATIDLDYAKYYLRSPVTIPTWIRIRGQGPNTTAFVNDSPVVCLQFDPTQGGGGSLEDMYITWTDKLTAAAPLNFLATAAGAAPDRFLMRRLDVSGPPTVPNAMTIDGSMRTTEPQGIRSFSIVDCDFFALVYAKGVVGLKVARCGFYGGAQSPSQPAQIGLYIAGGGTPQSNSWFTHIDHCNIEGVLDITNTTGGGWISGSDIGSIAKDGSAGWLRDGVPLP